MSVDSQRGLPPQLERYELKFTIPLEMIKPISDFVSVYCSPDQYSLNSKDGFYRVNNLYLDSPNYLFLQKRINSDETRFNIRVRSYGDSSLPYFLEIKQKKNGVITKYRAKVTDENWYKIYTEPGFEYKYDGNPSEITNKTLFERMIFTYNASPKVLTQYLRKAWVSDVDDYGRVTFDIDLRYMPETEYNLVPKEDEMLSCDIETIFDPGCCVVLELKCYTTQVPLWMIDLIKYFELRRRKFSKYLTGIIEVLGLYRYDLGNRAIITL